MMSLEEPRVAFVGAGVVGRALGQSLARAGYRVVGVSSRQMASAEAMGRELGCRAYQDAAELARAADLVFITTPDDAIEGVAIQIQQRGGWRPGRAVAHCSGALSLEPLLAARRAGALGGTMHPLQSFASVEQALALLPGTWWGLEADEELRPWLQAMVERLGGHYIWLRAGQKVLYHAAAVLASNYLVALMGMATELWRQFGVGRQEATEALLPLVQGTVRNLAEVGLPQCLTGPIARGDVGTVQRHLEALDALLPEVAAAYRLLGHQALAIASHKGAAPPERLAQLRRLLE